MKNVTVYYFTYIHYIQLKRSDMLAMNVVIIEINLMSHDDFCKRDMTNWQYATKITVHAPPYIFPFVFLILLT